MKNRLQKVFSHEEPSHFQGELSFNDKEHYAQFQKKINSAYMTGECQEIEGINKFSTSQTVGGKRYPLSSSDSINRIYISPYSEDLPILESTEFGDYIWNFKKTELKDKIIIENSKDAVFHIKLVILLDGKITISYDTNPNKANSIQAVLETFQAATAFFSRILKESTDVSKSLIASIKNDMYYWDCLTKLESRLEVLFCPQDLTGNPDDDETMLELYFSIIEGHAIRQNRGISNLTVACDENNVSIERAVGNTVSLSFLNSSDIDLLGVSLKIYTIDIIFNAVVDSIIKLEEKYEIRMKDTDIAPMYIAYKCFVTEQQRELEMQKLRSDFSQYVIEYSKAKTLYQLLNNQEDI